MTPELVAAALKMIGVLVLIVGGLLAFNMCSKRFFKQLGIKKHIQLYPFGELLAFSGHKFMDGF